MLPEKERVYRKYGIWQVRVVVRATVWQQICRARALARARQICCQALASTDNPLNVRRVSHWNFISSLWNLNSCFVESIWQSVASKSCRWEISFICHAYVFEFWLSQIFSRVLEKLEFERIGMSWRILNLRILQQDWMRPDMRLILLSNSLK